MLVIVGVIGVLISVLGILSGILIYIFAENAIHQIFATLLTMTGILGLVVVAVTVGASAVRASIRAAAEQASAERKALANAVLAVAEYKRVSSTSLTSSGGISADLNFPRRSPV